MGDIRISARPTMTANAESFFLVIDDEIHDLTAADAVATLAPGEHSISAILTRKDGETGAVFGEVSISDDENMLIDSIAVEVADWGDINRTKKTITV